MANDGQLTITAQQAAEYFLAHQDEYTGERISNLKLQKLCYYAQGFALGKYGNPLFGDAIKAWGHGPVIPALWHKYKENRYYSIAPAPIDDSDYPAAAKEILDLVIATYGAQSAWTLRDMTHEEDPWRDAREGEGSISPSALRAFFAPRIDRLAATQGKPRPLEKNKVREILRADEELREAVRAGMADFAAGRFQEAPEYATA
jgi:uncharacterized phage-associated protein